MTKFLLTLLLSVSLFSISNAQDFLIKGKVVDLETKNPLEATTIYAESILDSTLITYSITDQNGDFELEGKTSLKEFNIFFSYNGYQTLKMKIAKKAIIDLQTVQLEEQFEELQGVQVSGERVPITIKKDTLEFNADSFKTRPDATVEDVLKKLPGVEVDSNGKITVNGKEVNQVLVNGQVFFSNDPKVATKSLPKEIISKIQISNTKTKEQEFTGEDGDGETKTINLTIKEDKNKGYLGRMAAGYGTDDRYQANGLLNYFNNKKRVSIIASANNINNAGFSFDEIYDMVGNSRGGISFNNNGGFQVGGLSFGFGEGITTSSTLGASYADQEKGKYEVSSNYFFSYSDSYNDQKTSRENILPDRRYFTDTESSFRGSTNSNQGGANLEFDIDKTLRISLEPSLSVNRTNSGNYSNTISTDEDGETINSNQTATVSDGQQRNFSNEVTIFKRLDTIGKYIRVSFRNRNSESKNLSNLNSLREVFGTDPSEESLDQFTDSDDKNDSYRIGVRYRQPLAEKLFLDFGYEYENNERNNTRSVFDFNDVIGGYTNFNEALSSDFKFNNEQQTPSLGLNKNGEKLRLRLGAEYTTTNLKNNDFLQNTSFSKTYKNLLVRANINYNIDKSKRISLWYNSSLNIPSVNQLQPIQNVSNPLNIVVGNPNLSPSVNHRINIDYNDYNWKERTGFFIYGGVTLQDNNVSSVTTTDENFLRTTTYTNVNGNMNGYAGMQYSKEIKKDSAYSIKFNIRPYANYNKRVGFTNGQRLESKNLSFSPRISTTLNFREMVEIEPVYAITFNQTKYNLDGLEDVNFIAHNFQFKTTTYWPKNLIWGNDISYSYNGNVGTGFDKDAIFWNMSLGMQLMDKKATLKVLAYDLLNQNINTRRSSGDDFIQDFQGTVLQQYFMLSFSYKFDQFGGKKSRGGGVRFM
tara:strand:- start:39831 stop:42602 length:2772 start_codon:yes stop_codon:yes gene_type:complete